MKKLGFKQLPKNVKTRIIIIGFIISTLIGFASTENSAYRDENFLPTFIISLIIYFMLAYLLV